MTDLRLLEREMYAEAEAARLLDVAPSTLHNWLEGKTGRGGKVHRPVIRQEPKGTGAPVRSSYTTSLDSASSRLDCCGSTDAS